VGGKQNKQNQRTNQSNTKQDPHLLITDKHTLLLVELDSLWDANKTNKTKKLRDPEQNNPHLLIVNEHPPLLVELDSSRLEPHARRHRGAPDGHQHAVERLHLLARRERGLELAIGALLDANDL
jgi:hypothetical protein